MGLNVNFHIYSLQLWMALMCEFLSRQSNLLTAEEAALLDYGRCFSLTDMRFFESSCIQALGLKLV